MGRRYSDLSHATRAGMLCQDKAFRQFVASRAGLPDAASVDVEGATIWLREQCQVASRKELDQDAAARERFDRLKTEFDEWRGAIPSRR